MATTVERQQRLSSFSTADGLSRLCRLQSRQSPQTPKILGVKTDSDEGYATSRSSSRKTSLVEADLTAELTGSDFAEAPINNGIVRDPTIIDDNDVFNAQSTNDDDVYEAATSDIYDILKVFDDNREIGTASLSIEDPPVETANDNDSTRNSFMSSINSKRHSITNSLRSFATYSSNSSYSSTFSSSTSTSSSRSSVSFSSNPSKLITPDDSISMQSRPRENSTSENPTLTINKLTGSCEAMTEKLTEPSTAATTNEKTDKMFQNARNQGV